MTSMHRLERVLMGAGLSLLLTLLALSVSLAVPQSHAVRDGASQGIITASPVIPYQELAQSSQWFQQQQMMQQQQRMWQQQQLQNQRLQEDAARRAREAQESARRAEQLRQQQRAAEQLRLRQQQELLRQQQQRAQQQRLQRQQRIQRQQQQVQANRTKQLRLKRDQERAQQQTLRRKKQEKKEADLAFGTLAMKSTAAALPIATSSRVQALAEKLAKPRTAGSSSPPQCPPKCPSSAGGAGSGGGGKDAGGSGGKPPQDSLSTKFNMAASKTGGQAAKPLTLTQATKQQLARLPILAYGHRLTYDKKAKTYASPAGLKYGPDPQFGNRVKHVLSHTAPDPDKPNHTVFSVGRKDVLRLIDEAWKVRGAPDQKDMKAYIIDMKRVIGTNGETKIRIVVEKPGSDRVITAYPIK